VTQQKMRGGGIINPFLLFWHETHRAEHRTGYLPTLLWTPNSFLNTETAIDQEIIA